MHAVFELGWNQGRVDEVGDAVAETMIFHEGGATRTLSLDDLKRAMARWRSGFPDLVFEMHQLVVSGDLAAARLTMHGTHLGLWRDRPATGRRIAVEHMFFFRFQDGRIVEIWEMLDRGALDAQLGEAPDG